MLLLCDPERLSPRRITAFLGQGNPSDDAFWSAKTHILPEEPPVFYDLNVSFKKAKLRSQASLAASAL